MSLGDSKETEETGAETQQKEEEGMKLKREQGGKARQGAVSHDKGFAFSSGMV